MQKGLKSKCVALDYDPYTLMSKCDNPVQGILTLALFALILRDSMVQMAVFSYLHKYRRNYLRKKITDLLIFVTVK